MYEYLNPNYNELPPIKSYHTICSGFRIWDKWHKKYLDEPNNGSKIFFSFEYYEKHEEYFIIEESLILSHRTRIYENDIIHYDFIIGVLYYHGKWVLQNKNEFYCIDEDIVNFTNHSTVIGNMRENPELHKLVY